jgi:nucleoside-diphosphate-sugar epimerase
MKIAILGATSQIAKDLIIAFSKNEHYNLSLYSRRPEVVAEWLEQHDLGNHYPSVSYSEFNVNQEYQAIINFVGVGDPAQAAAMGAAIFDVTLHYDELALSYLTAHPSCRYLFLSSGAAYGSRFETPVDENTQSIININNLQPQEWYGAAKLHAECRHRALSSLPIIDIRVFNYFSHTQDITARFLITDIVRAIRDNTVLKTSSDYIVRDFIHPLDFHQLVIALLTAPITNTVVDCYSKAPIDKPNLLSAMQKQFDLKYELIDSPSGINATGTKSHYYSLNKKANYFGYSPAFSSIECIIQMTQKILQKQINLTSQ